MAQHDILQGLESVAGHRR